MSVINALPARASGLAGPRAAEEQDFQNQWFLYIQKGHLKKQTEEFILRGNKERNGLNRKRAGRSY